MKASLIKSFLKTPSEILKMYNDEFVLSETSDLIFASIKFLFKLTKFFIKFLQIKKNS